MTVSQTLLDAYLNTDYEVLGADTPFTLKINRFSDELMSLQRRHGVTSSAFLTAWNPFSREVPAEQNRLVQQKLIAELQARRHVLIEGYGRDASGKYSGEESVLVLGIGREEAVRLGEKYRQNAIVWCGQNAVPELILLVRPSPA